MTKPLRFVMVFILNNNGSENNDKMTHCVLPFVKTLVVLIPPPYSAGLDKSYLCFESLDNKNDKMTHCVLTFVRTLVVLKYHHQIQQDLISLTSTSKALTYRDAFMVDRVT